jgi:double-stranded uracil-DNA glycosylase
MPALPDLLAYDLKVVFCGTAAGAESARQAAYYAGPGNKFWPTLHKIGLTPHLLKPSDYGQLLGYGIGLTDLVKDASGSDADLESADFDSDGLRAKISEYQPAFLAFNGKRAAQTFLQASLKFGLSQERVGESKIFVLPSTSGAASAYWDEAHWALLALQIRALQQP